MKTQEDTAPPCNSADELNQRLLEMFALAQRHFRTAGLAYSQKLHQFFVDLGAEPAPTESEDEGETSAKSEA